MGMVTMSADGQDVDDNDDDGDMTIRKISVLMMTLDDLVGKQPLAAGLVSAAERRLHISLHTHVGPLRFPKPLENLSRKNFRPLLISARDF